jgi:hypothetical protein
MLLHKLVVETPFSFGVVLDSRALRLWRIASALNLTETISLGDLRKDSSKMFPAVLYAPQSPCRQTA